MSDPTSRQFAEEVVSLEAAPPPGRVCDRCSSRFTSSDARFCPFDGAPLRAALEGERRRDPLIGTVIDGRYEVHAVLGEGGMGLVYRVRHRVIERLFALKVLRADLSRDEELGLRFLREARAAASISHQNVVQITDFGNLPSGQPYFVMELVSGRSLSALIRKDGSLPASRAVPLLEQMIGALAAAHAAGVVHRDLKPDNILVCDTPSGECVKVLDFGLAKVAGQSRLTQNGIVFGTPQYMSPEQAAGATIDERTDVYALGIVMYQMFTGCVPFEADTSMGVLTKHLYADPTPPSVRLGDASALGALEQVTLCCLEKRPERRFPTMLALGAELRRVARHVGDGTVRVIPAEPRARKDPPREPVASGRGSDHRSADTRTSRKARIISWASVLAVISFGTATLFWAHRPSSSHAAYIPYVPSRPRSAAAPPPLAVPVTLRGAVPEPEPSAWATKDSAPTVPGRVHATPVVASRTGGRIPPAATERPGTKPMKGKEKIGGSDIVDPWSR